MGALAKHRGCRAKVSWFSKKIGLPFVAAKVQQGIRLLKRLDTLELLARTAILSSPSAFGGI